nr:MAG TPA: hypothetical protein [Caudoviricetes sp.]
MASVVLPHRSREACTLVLPAYPPGYRTRPPTSSRERVRCVTGGAVGVSGRTRTTTRRTTFAPHGDTDVLQRCYLLHTCYMKTGLSSKLAALTFKVTLNVAYVQFQPEL